MKVLRIIDGMGTGGKERRLLAFLKHARACPEVQNDYCRKLRFLLDTDAFCQNESRRQGKNPK